MAWACCSHSSSSTSTSHGIVHSTWTEILTHSTQISHIRNSIRPMFHLLRISHTRNSVRPTFHLLRIFHSRRMSPGERGRRFNFPGKTCSDPLVTLTRTAWLVRRSRFVGSISAHNKKAPTMLMTKSLELSLIFNARYIRQDIPKSSQVA